MHGNVLEFCREYLNGTLGSGARTDPVTTTIGLGFVIRGGYFGEGANDCRSARRGWRAPDKSANWYGGEGQNDGFRLWLTVE